MKKYLIFLLFIVLTVTVTAQDTLTGPHGGRIKISDMYRIESVGCDNYLEIYLFNEKMQPVFNNGIRGKIKFQDENKVLVAPLVHYGIDGFTAKIESSDFSSYEITFELLEKLVVKAKFPNECLIHK